MKSAYQTFIGFVWFISFWGFIAIKVGGTSFAAWSWLWVLLPIVPMLSLPVKALGL